MKKDGLATQTHHKPPISDIDKDRIYKHLSDWKTSPEHLAILAWWSITYHFCLCDSDIQAHLTADDLAVRTDKQGKTYLTLAIVFIQKDQQGGLTGKDSVSDGMIVTDRQAEDVLLLISKLITEVDMFVGDP
eukprot:scpid95760/ scgid26569/ 